MQQKFIALKYSAIPMFLRAGNFYRNLSCDDPEDVIEVPAECFLGACVKPTSLDQLAKLLRMANYWMLDKLHVNILIYLDDAVRNLDLDKLLHAVLWADHWDAIVFVTPYLKKNGNATLIAAMVGHLRFLEHVHGLGFEWHKETCQVAAAGGHIACLRFAHENGFSWESLRPENLKVTQFAALNGHLSCLMYAHQNGCPWDSTTVEGAAAYNHLECLQYALVQGCARNEDACCLAAKSGHLEAIVMLRAHGVRCSAKTCFHAAACASTACVQYLRENGCPWDKETTMCAASLGNIDTLRYALENGCPYDEASLIRDAVRRKSLVCIRYLVEERHFPVTDQELFIAALLTSDLECLQYLISHGCPCATARIRFNYEELLQLRKVLRSAEFMHCVEYALEHGWKMKPKFVKFVKNVATLGGTMQHHDQMYWMTQGWLLHTGLKSQLRRLFHLRSDVDMIISIWDAWRDKDLAEIRRITTHYFPQASYERS